MNKNIKKIITFAIICTAFSTWMPSTMNIGNQYAYAYSDDEISSLKITSGVSEIPIYSSLSRKNEFRIRSGNKIPTIAFLKISSDKTDIKLSTIDTKAADIRVFVGKSNLKLDDIYSEIKLEKGEKKSLYIKLYNSKKATDDEYTAEYEVVAERDNTNADMSELEDDTITLKQYDDIYLNKLILSNNGNEIDFNFDKTQSIYNINVDDNFSYIKINATPEQDGYKLLINDKDINTRGNNKNTSELLLDKGKNLIKIRIISDDHERREYFLNVTRGTIASTTTTSNNTGNNVSNNNTNTNNSNNTTDNKSSQTIQTGGNWQYRKADGTLSIGWTCIGSDWYYFDLTGAMKTGWLQASPGKWYYLKDSGIMAKDIMIDGYKLGADGAFVAK